MREQAFRMLITMNSLARALCKMSPIGGKADDNVETRNPRTMYFLSGMAIFMRLLHAEQGNTYRR